MSAEDAIEDGVLPMDRNRVIIDLQLFYADVRCKFMRKFYGHRTKSTNSVADVFGKVSIRWLSLALRLKGKILCL